jgi:hypothetical protein
MSNVNDGDQRKGGLKRDPKQQIDDLAKKLERVRQPAAQGPSRSTSTGGGAAAAARQSVSRARLARRTLQEARPLPPPPATRPALAATPRPPELTPEVQSQLSALQRNYTGLERKVLLSDVYDTVGRIESRLIALPAELDNLRRRGYLHSGQLEDRLGAIDEQWDVVMPQIQTSLKDHVRRLDQEMNIVQGKVNLANRGSATAIAAAETAVSSLESKANSAQSALRSLYGSIESELVDIERLVKKADWMIDQLLASPDIRLRDTEGPIAAVEAEWRRDGDEGPKGILYLTDQRLLFEQREEVVTKKKFGLFKAESEKIHTLHLDIAVHEIEKVEHSKEGGFLGVGKADILDMTCGGSAVLSRARFHLKGQNSSEWAAYIKRVQTGEIDADRHEGFILELADAAALAASFPSQCPNCLANLPEPPRGATRITCEFCGSSIGPL